MMHDFTPGQTFTMTNPDYNVIEETWTVDAIDGHAIQFSVLRRWVVDIAYVWPTSTEPYAAQVVRHDATGVIVTNGDRVARSGYRIDGDEITYLDPAAFAWYASRSEPV